MGKAGREEGKKNKILNKKRGGKKKYKKEQSENQKRKQPMNKTRSEKEIQMKICTGI